MRNVQLQEAQGNKRHLGTIQESSQFHSRFKGKIEHWAYWASNMLDPSVPPFTSHLTLTTCSGSPKGPTAQVVISLLAAVGSTGTGVDQIFAAMLDMVGWSKLHQFSIIEQLQSFQGTLYITLQCHLCLTPAISSRGLTLLNCWTFKWALLSQDQPLWCIVGSDQRISVLVTSITRLFHEEFVADSSRTMCFPGGPRTVEQV